MSFILTRHPLRARAGASPIDRRHRVSAVASCTTSFRIASPRSRDYALGARRARQVFSFAAGYIATHGLLPGAAGPSIPTSSKTPQRRTTPGVYPTDSAAVGIQSTQKWRRKPRIPTRSPQNERKRTSTLEEIFATLSVQCSTMFGVPSYFYDPIGVGDSLSSYYAANHTSSCGTCDVEKYSRPTSRLGFRRTLIYHSSDDA
ncbi:hypothetical protein DFH09DRAFT_1094394 [Mycena vulgaris]|nr:hypothetical protein DFH09DRAFT_1094394 [Mycena vulgaris]